MVLFITYITTLSISQNVLGLLLQNDKMISGYLIGKKAASSECGLI